MTKSLKEEDDLFVVDYLHAVPYNSRAAPPRSPNHPNKEWMSLNFIFLI